VDANQEPTDGAALAGGIKPARKGVSFVATKKKATKKAAKKKK
jgi:hypothetical protein